MLSCLPQGILAAVLGAVLGSKDPEQVSTMAKQAGEVSTYENGDFLRKIKENRTTF